MMSVVLDSVRVIGACWRSSPLMCRFSNVAGVVMLLLMGCNAGSGADLSNALVVSYDWPL